MKYQDPFGFTKAIQIPKSKKDIDKIHKILFKNKKKSAYKWKSTEEAEEYFLGKDPKKHKDYKRLLGDL